MSTRSATFYLSALMLSVFAVVVYFHFRAERLLPLAQPPAEILPVAAFKTPSEPLPTSSIPIPDSAAIPTTGTIRGSVTYADTGEPARDMVIAVYGGPPKQVKTDDDGHYLLTGLPPSAYEVVVAEPGPRLKQRPFPFIQLYPDIPETADIELYYPELGTVSGKAIDSTVVITESEWAQYRNAVNAAGEDAARGNALFDSLLGPRTAPMRGVRIVLESKREQGERFETITNAAGQYSFAAVFPGPYTLWADAPPGAAITQESGSSLSRDLDVGEGEKKTDIDFSFRLDGAVVSGRVCDSRGLPITGAMIKATQDNFDGEGYPRSPTPTVTAISGPDGRYRLEGLIPLDIYSAALYPYRSGLNNDTGNRASGITYSVAVEAAGYLPARITLPIVTERNLRDGARFLDPMFELIARHGKEVPKMSRGPLPIPASTGNEIMGIDFRLEPPNVVAGQVVDFHSVPMSRCRVFLKPSENQDERLLVQRAIMPEPRDADEEGYFWFDSVPAGTYMIEVYAEDTTLKARNESLRISHTIKHGEVRVVVERPPAPAL